MKICIDPGHQKIPDLITEPISPGSEIMKPRTAPGACGLRTGIYEYEIVLNISLLIEEILTRIGVETILTRRSNDVKLSNIERANIANDSGAGLCIKLHCNGVSPSLKYVAFCKRGTLTIIPTNEGNKMKIYGASKKLAQIIHPELLKETGFPDLGIQERKDITGFNWSLIPAILLEIGYLTNPIEEKMILNSEFQYRIANTIARSLVKAFDVL